MGGARFLFSMLFVLLLAPTVLAATLHGTIYTTGLSVANNVLVEVDSTPTQRMLSKDGLYAFTLNPGTYTIIATYKEDGFNVTSTERATIESDGDFVFDLFLLPDLDFQEDELLDDDELIEETISDPEPSRLGDVLTRALLVIIVLAFFYFVWRYYRKRELVVDAAEDEAAATVLRILKQQGGRCTQKDIRKELPLSEAKISLVISDLEARGKLQKIRKGRANILVLKK